jgi:hypothetical protein
LNVTVPGSVPAGSYPFTVTLTNTNNSTFVQSSGTLVVGKADLTARANAKSKI